MQLVHLEPVEDAALDGLDQVAGLELRLLARVAAHERCALEHRVVELAARRVVRADRADESALSQPLAAEHRILRRRHRDDDVGVRRVAMRLGRLAAVARGRTRRAARRSGSRRRRARSWAPPPGWRRSARPPANRSRSRRASRRPRGRGTSPPRPMQRRSGSARACRPRSPPRAASEARARRAARRTASRFPSRHTTSGPRTRARGRRTPSPRTARRRAAAASAGGCRRRPARSGGTTPRRPRPHRPPRAAQRRRPHGDRASRRDSLSAGGRPPRPRRGHGYTGFPAPVAQGIERCPAEAEAASSNLAGRMSRTSSEIVGARPSQVTPPPVIPSSGRRAARELRLRRLRGRDDALGGGLDG